MHHVTISPKFQVVIPRVVRERLGLRPIASQTPCGIVSPVNLPPSRFSCGPPAQRTETNFQSAQRKRLLLRQVFPGPCRSLLPAPPRAFGAVLAALLVAGVAPADLRANTTLDSGTTTLSTGTDYGHTLYVGKTDAATLKVNAGGHATNFEGFLGYNAAAFGTVTVESGGRWTNSGRLYVGNHGTGILNVTGGSVTSGGSILGDYDGSVGTVTVTSGTWANSDNLAVGYHGTGTLNVTGGSVKG